MHRQKTAEPQSNKMQNLHKLGAINANERKDFPATQMIWGFLLLAYGNFTPRAGDDVTELKLRCSCCSTHWFQL